MRKLHYLLALVLSMLTIYSCSNDYNELDEVSETTESFQRSLDLSVKSLATIQNPLVSKQLSTSKKHMTEIISQEFGYFLDGYDLKGLSLDENNVLVFNNADGIKSYSFAGTISGDKEAIDFRLTLNFNEKGNLNNYVQLGGDEPLYFDSEGKLSQNTGRYWQCHSN